MLSLLCVRTRYVPFLAPATRTSFYIYICSGILKIADLAYITPLLTLSISCNSQLGILLSLDIGHNLAGQ